MIYFLAHNEIDVFHYGKLEDNQILESGQPYVEYFNTLEELKQRLSFFNIEYTKNINEYTENIDRNFLEEQENNLIA